MQGPVFDELFALLSAAPLSGDNLARLRAWIAGIHDPAECLALIEAAAAGRPCPHCRAARVHRSGFASGLQRFRCLGCRRTYNALTGTPLARLRKRERWLPYLQCLLESRSVRDAARVAGVPWPMPASPKQPASCTRRSMSAPENAHAARSTFKT